VLRHCLPPASAVEHPWLLLSTCGVPCPVRAEATHQHTTRARVAQTASKRREKGIVELHASTVLSDHGTGPATSESSVAWMCAAHRLKTSAIRSARAWARRSLRAWAGWCRRGWSARVSALRTRTTVQRPCDSPRTHSSHSVSGAQTLLCCFGGLKDARVPVDTPHSKVPLSEIPRNRLHPVVPHTALHCVTRPPPDAVKHPAVRHTAHEGRLQYCEVP
jgi:hypothetical protein